MNILIVDDEPGIIKFLGRFVKGWGHSYKTAVNGHDALIKVNREKFDVIILDIFLPDTTAHSLITKFKDLYPDIIIIKMTGQNTEELESEIRSLGIAYYMSKPIQIEELEQILSHWESKIRNMKNIESQRNNRCTSLLI